MKILGVWTFEAPIKTLELRGAPMPVRTLWDCIPWTLVYDVLGPVVGLR